MSGTVYTADRVALFESVEIVYLSPSATRFYRTGRFAHYLPPAPPPPSSPVEAPERPSNGWEWVREGMGRASRLEAVQGRDLKDLAAALAAAIRIINRMEDRA